MLLQLDAPDRQFLDTLFRMKLTWSTEVFPRLYDEYRARVREPGDEPASWRDVARLLEPTVLYRFYASLERDLQRQKYAVLIPALARKERQLRAELASAPRRPAKLDLDLGLSLPGYYTSVDFHQHPGGVWSDDIDGFVYEYAAESTNPTFASNTEIFRRLAHMLSGQPGRRILDMGCGFGKTTVPLAEVFPGAEIVGVDLAAPCLKVAWLRAAQRGLAITYVQRNAERTGFPDESFDLVTAHQLLHEVPRPALRNILREAFRVLRAGARFVALDFHSPGGPFAIFIHYGHARRNNEVYMKRFDQTDLSAEFARVGFTGFSMVPFGNELGLGGVPDGSRPREWRFPWKLISATKPVAG